MAEHAAHADSHEEHHPRLQHHFASMAVQAHAARLGMWLFLATEILLFGANFVGYSVYRNLYHEGFAAASGLLSKTFGLIDTFDLITSSFTMAMAIHWGRERKHKLATAMLLITAAMGVAFLVLHSYEYWHDYSEGALPGKFYHVEHAMVPGASMFYALYFIMTGLHSFHVFVGVVVLLWLAWRAWRQEFDEVYDTPLELGGMYWHLVDLIWIFLFPLLYLI
jgi:cytochrome c oxidase subunit 3